MDGCPELEPDSPMVDEFVEFSEDLLNKIADRLQLSREDMLRLEVREQLMIHGCVGISVVKDIHELRILTNSELQALIAEGKLDRTLVIDSLTPIGEGTVQEVQALRIRPSTLEVPPLPYFEKKVAPWGKKGRFHKKW